MDFIKCMKNRRKTWVFPGFEGSRPTKVALDGASFEVKKVKMAWDRVAGGVRTAKIGPIRSGCLSELWA